MILDFWLWKYNFGIFWLIVIHCIQKVKWFPLSVLIFEPKILLFKTLYFWNSTTKMTLYVLHKFESLSLITWFSSNRSTTWPTWCWVTTTTKNWRDLLPEVEEAFPVPVLETETLVLMKMTFLNSQLQSSVSWDSILAHHQSIMCHPTPRIFVSNFFKEEKTRQIVASYLTPKSLFIHS